MSHLTRRGALLSACVCLVAAALASSALAASSKPVFRPRIGNALGLIPPVNDQGKKNFEPSENGIFTPVTYHGGPTMTGGVTVHAIFWAPPGYSFPGAPPGSKSTEGLLEQYFNDVRVAGTGTAGQPCTTAACNVFTVEPQYGWGTTPGGVTPGQNTINFSTATDVVHDTDPYPNGCSSPQDTKACVTDAQVQSEVDKIVQGTPGKPRGLSNIWYVFFPPNVDECISQGVCGTTAFGGYHSLSNVNGHGLTVYAITIDPSIEIGGVHSGEDPQGNPDAEDIVDIAAHETNESMSDPTGVGWMDPNGWENADKCEFGPQHGNFLGFAANGSPYNQVVNGHKYLIQEVWSNSDNGCVQASDNTSNALPLPQVDLTQFSSTVTGNTENNTPGIGVKVKLIRADASGSPTTLATGSTTTAGDGSWTVRLSGGRAVGDDRDQLEVDYSGAGAPPDDTILTGNGGDPFFESGWTGWTALDEGVALANHDPSVGGPSLSIGPCFQTGVLTYTGASGPEPATDFCGTASDVATTPLNAPVTRGDRVTVSSNDDRAFSPSNLPGGGNPAGALVKLTVPVGEPDSAPNFAGDLPPFTPTGFPTCAAGLDAQAVDCSGLVPGESYTLTDGSQVAHAMADGGGTVTKHMSLAGGQTVALSNGSRTLTTLHVAHLRVHIFGDSGAVARGTCTPGEYWGGPLSSAPANDFAGMPTALSQFGGAALTGQVCPASGNATGLPTDDIAQTDEQSGGETLTSVADVLATSPLDGETLYGKFTALAEASDVSSPISLKIMRRLGERPVFSARNVDSASGVEVRGLKPGKYVALWTVRNANGDSRSVITRLIEQSGTAARPKSRPKPGVTCRHVGRHNHHRMIQCHVRFQRSAHVRGTLRMRISRGNRVAALGHGRLHAGSATITMRQLRPLKRGSWQVTLVVLRGGHRTETIRVPLLVL